MVDAADSKSAVRDDVSVRVRPSGPYKRKALKHIQTWGLFYCLENCLEVGQLFEYSQIFEKKAVVYFNLTFLVYESE